MKCPCGSDADLAACCGPRLDGSRPPETAEALMRSRYTAHVLVHVDYILETHDPDTVHEVDREEVNRWARATSWDGLHVIDAVDGGPDDERGVVEFAARFVTDGETTVHHERSTFRRVDGAWRFVRGGPGAKPGRNAPCICGSGKKYKRCCGR